jgi:membrane protease YdiL (CAAX protease family)
VSPTTVIATLPLGIAAGYFRERTGSAKSAITFHILHNFLGELINFILKQIQLGW